MKSLSWILICTLFITVCSFSPKEDPRDPVVYSVKKLKRSMKIDGDWNKPQWKKIKEIPITNFMRAIPAFKPVTKAKMMYDYENLYLIFHVEDRYVRIQMQDFNSHVSGDACVEFFFSPDSNVPLGYFNLEINAGGTPLMAYHIFQQKEYKRFSVEDLKLIEIAHSLPNKLDNEITEPVTWTLEYRLPLALLKKYSNIAHPKPGVSWKANFYKTSSRSSNPHWVTWSFVDSPTPQFHLPQFFGTIKFK